MKSGRPDRASVIAAAVLAALTLGVFLVARDRGPLSSVQRWHAYVKADDAENARRLFTPDSDPMAAQQLYVVMRTVLRGERKILLGEKEYRNNQAWVDIAYETESGLFVLRYSLKKVGPLWLIDANETRDRAPESFFANSG